MNETLHILHALSEHIDPAQLSGPITAKFPSARQDLAASDDLLIDLQRRPYSILFLDSRYSSTQSLPRLFTRIKNEFKDLIVILLIDGENPEDFLPGIGDLAFFHLTRPIEAAEVVFCVNHCKTLFSHRVLRDELNRKNRGGDYPGFIGRSLAMKSLFDIIARVAEDDHSTVLIRGESGTGKELVAKAIHHRSSRRKHHFVPVNCAAIPDELLESELFGHLKGSFTGAAQNKTGRIQYADNGTLFLDEIGDMKPNLQAKLLRVIQEREFEPVGSLKATPVNTRIVAATHCDLEALVEKGLFREDLFYRLSVVPLEVPPLRERIEDISALLEEFIDRHTTRRGRDKIVFSPESIEILLAHPWRGNVRELENLVQHMAILYSGKRILPHHLPPRFSRGLAGREEASGDQAGGSPPPSINDISAERAALFSFTSPPTPSIHFDRGPINFNELINEFETELIVKAMKFTAGNKKEASRMLNLKRTTLLEKIKKKDIEGRWEE